MYAFEREPRFPRILRSLIALGVVLFLLYWVGSFFLRLLGFGGATERASSTLFTEGRGIISVSLQGEDEQPAENGMNMFPGDTISTNTASKASLQFFDGTWARMDGQTSVSIDETSRGEDEAALELTLKEGTLWMATPSARSFTGSITRALHTPSFTLSLPARAEVVVRLGSVMVYAADGEGVRVSAKGTDPFVVGEGQKWEIPEGGDIGDPYDYRHALEPADLNDPFVKESRVVMDSTAPQQPVTGSGGGANASEPLVLTSPETGFTLRDATLTVRGTVGPDVRKVTVNGREAVLDAQQRTFAQEVSPPEGATTFDLQVKVLDADGATLAAITRTIAVQRSAEAPESVVITGPAAAGETFRTDAAELIIRGTSPASAVAIYVNEYKLQLFTPEKGTWSYLASVALGNMKAGTNVYDVVAVDAAGKRSAPARITVVQGQGTGEGTVQSPTPSSAAAMNPATLPQNSPLAPGTLSVSAPTAGLSHTETGTGFLLEGKTSAQTASVWVNDYRLQLYTAGKTYWNYIASAQFGNLKRGKNVYRVVARNENNEILDVLEYEVTFNPGE